MYIRCLEIDIKELEPVLKIDETHWAENFKKTKKESSDIKLRLDALLKRQMEELARELNAPQSMQDIVPAPRSRRFSLRRLPMFGEQIDESMINFKWPEQKHLDEIPENTYLKQMIFARTLSSEKNLCAIKFKLSNGYESPLVQKTGI